MATIRKKNGKWHVQVRRKGVAAVSRTFPVRDWAVRWATETERDIARGAVPVCVSDLRKTLLAELLNRYLVEVTPQKRGAVSESSRLKRLMGDPIALLSLDRLTTAAVADYRNRRLKLVSGAAVRRELTILRHCLEVAGKEWGVPIISNPVRSLSLPPDSRPRRRRLSPEELDRLLEEASRRSWYIAPLIRFAVATGLRRGEILSLTWRDIELERGTALLRITKNNDSRTVPLSSVALAVLKTLPRGEDRVFSVSANAARLIWERTCKAAGISDLRFHDLRHEAISRFFEMGLTHPEVALLSGHRDTRMLLRYAHAQKVEIRRKFERRLLPGCG